MQVRKNLYQVSGSLNGITWTGTDTNFDDANVYVLDTGSGLILFDCGNGETWSQIEDNMKYWGLNPDNIKACFLTHGHIDHAGASAMLSAKGIKIYAHKETAEAVMFADERCCGFFYHKIMTPCSKIISIEDGENVNICNTLIKVKHYPGHTQGCTAFVFEHEKETIVVSGDIIGTLLVGHFGWDGSIDFDKKVYTESLLRFSKLDTDIMLPGHGLIYFHKPRRRVEEVLGQALSLWR
jgi:glyoxylase-like metal-dependent hydrolase (beta-lactamase superfamily II)